MGNIFWFLNHCVTSARMIVRYSTYLIFPISLSFQAFAPRFHPRIPLESPEPAFSAGGGAGGEESAADAGAGRRRRLDDFGLSSRPDERRSSRGENDALRRHLRLLGSRLDHRR